MGFSHRLAWYFFKWNTIHSKNKNKKRKENSNKKAVQCQRACVPQVRSQFSLGHFVVYVATSRTWLPRPAPRAQPSPGWLGNGRGVAAEVKRTANHCRVCWTLLASAANCFSRPLLKRVRCVWQCFEIFSSPLNDSKRYRNTCNKLKMAVRFADVSN